MRVIIADDSVILREGLARLLVEAGFEVVGQAGDGTQLLAQADAQRPDVAIIDIRMPPTHTDEGLRAAGELRARHPGIGVLMLSQYVRPSYAEQPSQVKRPDHHDDRGEQPSLNERSEPPGREGQEDIGDPPEVGGEEGMADREHGWILGPVQRRGEPEKAGQSHDRTDRVVRP